MASTLRRRTALPARLAGAALLAASLGGCVVVPVTAQRYDARCQQVTRRVTLQAVQVGAIASCANEGCEALVLAAAVSVAASTIVSGSIAVVGNVAYWAEERRGCHPREGDAAAAVTGPSPTPVPRPGPAPSAGPAAAPSAGMPALPDAATTTSPPPVPRPVPRPKPPVTPPGSAASAPRERDPVPYPGLPPAGTPPGDAAR